MIKSFALMACAVSAVKIETYDENALDEADLHPLSSDMIDAYIECWPIWYPILFEECIDEAAWACIDACMP